MAKVAATAALLTELILIAEGKATRYNPGVMDQVVANRLQWRQITPEQVNRAEGFIALADRRHLGRMAWIEWPSGEVSGPFLVVDCGAEKDLERLRQIGFAVDLSYELAERYLERMDAPLRGVKVYLGPEREGEE